MIFVDSNVFMYAVGREHSLRAEARRFFATASADHQALVTSAEVLQELLHAYLPVNRVHTLAAACELIDRSTIDVWPLESEDVRLAHHLRDQFPEIGARDLCHFASCRRRGINRIKTFDRGLSVIAERYL